MIIRCLNCGAEFVLGQDARVGDPDIVPPDYDTRFIDDAGQYDGGFANGCVVCGAVGEWEECNHSTD